MTDTLTIGDTNADGTLSIEDTAWMSGGELRVTVRDRSELPRSPERVRAARDFAKRALDGATGARFMHSFRTAGPSMNYTIVVSDTVSR